MKVILNFFAIAAVTGLSLNQKRDIYGTYDIYDADGDGVQDNHHHTRMELDDFFYPNAMGDAGEDVFNTHHGDYPGHVQKEWVDEQTAPEDSYTLVKKSWNNI